MVTSSIFIFCLLRFKMAWEWVFRCIGQTDVYQCERRYNILDIGQVRRIGEADGEQFRLTTSWCPMLITITKISWFNENVTIKDIAATQYNAPDSSL
jgi:hypothetical protein